MVKKGKLQMRVRCVCLIIIFFIVSVLITGCGEEDITKPEEKIDEPEDPCISKFPPHTGPLFIITPVPGEIISPTQEFMLHFDLPTTEATVNGISATGSGYVWVVSLILAPGMRFLTVEWTESNGCIRSQVSGPYTVVADED